MHPFRGHNESVNGSDYKQNNGSIQANLIQIIDECFKINEIIYYKCEQKVADKVE